MDRKDAKSCERCKKYKIEAEDERQPPGVKAETIYCHSDHSRRADDQQDIVDGGQDVEMSDLKEE